MKVAVYPGTFDPIHNGHVHIIERAIAICEKLIVGVADNPRKKTCMGIDSRVQLIRAVMKRLNYDVDVESFDCLLSTFATQKGASCIIRGMRNFSDFEYEHQMCSANYKNKSKIETVFLIPTKSNFISSRLIKEISYLQGDIGEFAPKEVSEVLCGLATKKKFL